MPLRVTEETVVIKQNKKSIWQGPFKWFLLVWVLAALGLGGAYGFLLSPQQQQLQQLQIKVKGLDMRLTQLQRAQPKSYQEQQRQALVRQQQQCADLLFNKEALDRLDFRLQELARDNQVQSFESRNIFEHVDTQIEKLKQIDLRKIQTQCEASFPEFLYLLNSIERNEPTLFVTQFGLSQTFDPGQRPLGQIEIFALHEKSSPVAKK